MATRITVDPVTRIEGHLRIDVEVDQGRITNAWSSGTMWRGIEQICQGLDPRDLWLYTQRICGVCTTVHAIASVRAVENALNMEIPVNAQYIRNMIVCAHAIHDNVVHFYHLSALDWVDVTKALEADPKKAAAILEPLSTWSGNSVHQLARVKGKLKRMVDSGQLGIFANGYWGHKEMKLSPEVNLIAVAHYLQALEFQRDCNRIVAILGGKNPHIQNLAVGGVANPINLNSVATLNMERLVLIKSLIDNMNEFVEQVYKLDIAVIAAHYPEWLELGATNKNYLALPELPMDGKNGSNLMMGGYIENGDLSTFRQIKYPTDPYLVEGIEESHKHAWFDDDDKAHPPWQGSSNANYTGYDGDDKYSWCKAPSFYGKAVEVGPIAEVMCMVASDDPLAKKHVGDVLAAVKTLTGTQLQTEHLNSTLGRHACRAIRCGVIKDHLPNIWQALIDNIGKGDTSYYVKPQFPEGIVKGVGFHEAPRGILSHWIVIVDGKTANYQCVVPSTWNSGPRNQNDEMGPYEQSLIGTPIADIEKPLEILRTIHSFDPCMSCAAHLFDLTSNREIGQFKIL